MVTAQILQASERLFPLAYFALYLITSVQIVRYSSWIQAGAPNPFLSDTLLSKWRRSRHAHNILMTRLAVAD